jgi:aminopeptidase N
MSCYTIFCFETLIPGSHVTVIQPTDIYMTCPFCCAAALRYASRIGPQVLTFFEQYFQIPFPLKKQDMAAVPDLSFGAMENWGLITYRYESSVLSRDRGTKCHCYGQEMMNERML